MLACRRLLRSTCDAEAQKNREIAMGATSLLYKLRVGSGCLRLVLSFSKNSAAVKSVINYLSYSRSIRVHVHSITGTQVAQDALCCDLTGYATQFRIAPSLDVVDPKNSFVKR
jgi:hypothetical protein